MLGSEILLQQECTLERRDMLEEGHLQKHDKKELSDKVNDKHACL